MILNIDTHSDCGTREFPLNMYGTGHGFPSNPPPLPGLRNVVVVLGTGADCVILGTGVVCAFSVTVAGVVGVCGVNVGGTCVRNVDVCGDGLIVT